MDTQRRRRWKPAVIGAIVVFVLLVGWRVARLYWRDVPRNDFRAMPRGGGETGPESAKGSVLEPLLREARQAQTRIEKDIRDYSVVMASRQRLDKKLQSQCMFLKVRQKPFSVYMYFLEPAELKGREVIYVEGANEGKLAGHTTGLFNLKTAWLDPKGWFAMQGQRYPITEIGLLRLTQQISEVAEKHKNCSGCEVKRLPAKIRSRACTCIEVVHPKTEGDPVFYLGRIFVDEQYNLPIRYEGYEWPEGAKAPQLDEEYTYLDLKLNVGFTDADFDVRNPKYKFP